MTDEQIRPTAERLRIIYDGLGILKTDDEIWELAIEEIQITGYFKALEVTNERTIK